MARYQTIDTVISLQKHLVSLATSLPLGSVPCMVEINIRKKKFTSTSRANYPKLCTSF